MSKELFINKYKKYIEICTAYHVLHFPVDLNNPQICPIEVVRSKSIYIQVLN